MINARARSRCRPAGPNKAPRSSVLAIAHTAATWPCGTERVICIACPAGNNCSPRRLARITSIAPAGNALILANVWCLTLPSSRKVRRTRCDLYSRSRPSLFFRRLITVATCIASEDLPMSTNIRPARRKRHPTRRILLATFFRSDTPKTQTPQGVSPQTARNFGLEQGDKAKHADRDGESQRYADQDCVHSEELCRFAGVIAGPWVFRHTFEELRPNNQVPDRGNDQYDRPADREFHVSAPPPSAAPR